MTNIIAWWAMIFWGHNVKPFQSLLNKGVDQQSWNATFSHSIWKFYDLLTIVCWLVDSEINYLDAKRNPNCTQAEVEVRWGGGTVTQALAWLISLVSSDFQRGEKFTEQKPDRVLTFQTGCRMVRLLSVCLPLSHLAAWINVLLSATSEKDHRGKYHLCTLVNFDGLLRYFTFPAWPPGKRAIIFVQLVPFATLTNSIQTQPSCPSCSAELC